MKKNSNTSSTLLSSKKHNKGSLLDVLYNSADPACIQAANELQVLHNRITLSNKNFILLINAINEIEYIAYMRDKGKEITVDQLELRLDEIINICEDVKGILDEQ